mgnify:CR=1 FL=1
MIRILITVILPLLAPTIGYMLWIWFLNKKKKDEADHRPLKDWQTWPWSRLLGLGSVLLIISIVAINLNIGQEVESGRYIPPHMKDGEIVPGRFVDETE